MDVEVPGHAMSLGFLARAGRCLRTAVADDPARVTGAAPRDRLRLAADAAGPLIEAPAGH
jgi:hypothetical protein